MSFKDLNQFDYVPVKMNLNRSRFNLSHDHKTTFNAGELIPIMVKPVLPDDTWKISVASVVRSITPAVPVMDNAFLDIFCFWVPNRIACVHPKDWEKIFGENVNGYWAPSTESTLVSTGNTATFGSAYTIKVGSLAQYLGMAPVGYYHTTQNLSRLRAHGYWEIYNNWFRDQNNQAPIDWKSFNNNTFALAVSDNGLNSKLCKVNKIHDYFTSCLPSPAKTSTSVLVPLGSTAPVITGTDFSTGTNATPVHWNVASSGVAQTTGYAASWNSQDSKTVLGRSTASATATASSGVVPSNLYADLSNAAAATINDIRQAFAIQRLFEKDARMGSRYREYLKGHFGVAIPDNTVQVPEYLGGKRIPLNMLQVLQTSENGTNPLGTTGAFSNTADNSYITTKSFAEFGNIFILACIRTCQSYSQGIDCDIIKNRRLDWYDPVFANLGEKAVKTSELFANNLTDFSEVFGYQEAWAEYRYIPNHISGYMAAGSGDAVAQSWTYQNHFSSKPVLNSDFMVQPRSQVDNTLVVTNATYQYIADFHFDIQAWRAMPYYSIPGLIDHH